MFYASAECLIEIAKWSRLSLEHLRLALNAHHSDVQRATDGQPLL